MEASALPERYRTQEHSAFRLPGSEELSAFADLLGDMGENAPIGPEAVPFSVPQLLPEDVTGPVTLWRDIRFGALSGDHAAVAFSHVCGQGTVTLGEKIVGRFSTGALSLDVTDAMLLARTQRLALHFDETRPAGIAGPVALRVSRLARIESVALRPDAARKRLFAKIRLVADESGEYLLRFLLPGADRETAVCERILSLHDGVPETVTMDTAFDAPLFICGKPYAPKAVRVQLFSLRRPRLPLSAPKSGLLRAPLPSPIDRRPSRPATLCDETALSVGMPGPAPACWLPLTPQDMQGAPDALAKRLQSLGVTAVFLPGRMPDPLYAALTRCGIAALHPALPSGIRETLMRHPCAFVENVPGDAQDGNLIRSAWRMCGMISSPRPIPQDSGPSDLLRELFGKPLDAKDPGIRAMLLWLRALAVRLGAESMRQGRCAGALTAPGEWENQDILEALRTALAPAHLSALPLYGAWWAQTRFFATVHAFLPEGWQGEEPVTATVTLEDEQGQTLAKLQKPVTRVGYLGMLDATLPDHACVLELTCTLRRGGEILDSNTLPVYVGVKAQLEAAMM